MEPNGSWLLVALVGAEIAFWALLVAGLAARYVLRLRRTSTVLLLGVPVADVVFIALAVADLERGTEPDSVHGLAAVYLGFSVGFGHYVVSRADAWFAHRFAGGPPPGRVPSTGPRRVRHEWQEWRRVVTAWVIAVAALLTMRLVAGWSVPATARELWSTDELWSWVARLTLIAVAWLLTGPVYATLFRRGADRETDDPDTPDTDSEGAPAWTPRSESDRGRSTPDHSA